MANCLPRKKRVKTKQAYGAIADLYESIMREDVDYGEWADYVLSLIKAYSPGKTGADVGCGSGVFTTYMKRSGYDVTGFDVSPEMLACAQRSTREQGLSVNYVLQDMRSFKPMGKVNFITALTDCVNYVDGGDMLKTFRRFYTALTKNGALIFDISTEYKLKNVIGSELFGEDSDDYSYLWFNRAFDGGVEMDISLFTKNADGSYKKKEEHHVQYIHTEDEVESALRQAGFTTVIKQGHLGRESAPDAQRINFIALKD